MDHQNEEWVVGVVREVGVIRVVEMVGVVEVVGVVVVEVVVGMHSGISCSHRQDLASLSNFRGSMHSSSQPNLFQHLQKYPRQDPSE